ncbi:MAG: hypothetical protein JWN08_203 [Frankiales bacterium]|nr:hypothetical protein [Frankiales bacterium]
MRDRLFAWQRPLLKTELAALGATAPDGPLLGVRVADEAEKHAVIAERPECCLTTPHFDGYPAVLVQLDVVPLGVLDELVTDSRRARAGPKLLKAFDEGR